ncbi:MAG: FkbM family methyltransferase [Bacteroidetes bacterium]|nr:MAG: FkbM family methyltransferase [Bacteroidota bacterium]
MNFYWRKTLGLIRSRLIYYWKPFNKRKLKGFYSTFIKPGDLCFDIGAHLGNRSDAWLSLGAKVIAVEPQPGCTEFLKNKFSHLPDFTLIEKAVGKEQGKATLHISSLTPTVTTLSSENWRTMINESSGIHVAWDTQIEVEVITLDDLISQYGIPAFCKIDVENFELEVLEGLHEVIPALSVEFFSKTPDMTIACIKRLEALGSYEYNWSFGESQKMVNKDWQNSRETINLLSNLSPGAPSSGDLYAKLINVKNDQ